jgi:uncharacterized protein (TIGR02266 family)
MHTYNESRKSKRVKTRLRVNCKSEGIFFSDFTRDVGLGGMGVETATLIRAGTLVELFLHLPDEKDPLILNGKVIWAKVKEVKEKTTSNIVIGIQFENIEQEHRNKLNSFIVNHPIDN